MLAYNQITTPHLLDCRRRACCWEILKDSVSSSGAL